jgi:hypothetical protein
MKQYRRHSPKCNFRTNDPTEKEVFGVFGTNNEKGFMLSGFSFQFLLLMNEWK